MCVPYLNFVLRCYFLRSWQFAVLFSTKLAIYELWIYASNRFIKTKLGLTLCIVLDVFRQ